jgi:hypothetical protein
LTESPDWLIHLYQLNHNNDQYIKELKSDYEFLCKFNKIDPDLYDFDYKIQMIDVLNTENDDEKQKKNFFSFISDYWKDRFYLRKFFLSIFLWIVNQIIFYCCITNLDLFGIVINGAYKLFFIANIISNILVGIFSSRIGLNNVVKYISWVTTLLLILLYLNPFNMLTMQIIFFMFGLVGNFVGETIYLHIPELFPANIRSTSVAYSKIPSKVLLIVSPFIFRAALNYIYYIFIFLTALSPVIIHICN